MIYLQCTEFFLLTCPALINLVWVVLIKIPTIQIWDTKFEIGILYFKTLVSSWILVKNQILSPGVLLISGYSVNILLNIEESYDQQSFSNKRPVDESDGYEQQVTKKMRVEAGDGPNTLLRILVNSKDAGGIIGKVYNLLSCYLMTFIR